MSEEWFTAIALPVSVRDDARAHVTVFVAPTLRPDHKGTVLGEFDLFRDWAGALADGATVTLVDQSGEMDAELDLSALDPSLWRRAFDEGTPVLANRVPEWQGRDWRTFAAKDCADIAKSVHLATVAADPLTPVPPSAHPLLQGVVGMANEAGAITYEGRGTHGRRGSRVPTYDESKLTAYLDKSLVRGRRGAWTTPAAGALPDPTGSVGSALEQLHLARRFYERPESQFAEQVRHDPPAKVEPLDPPAPEFHERVGAAGDHPAFLRRLGLLLPVRSDPARLRRSEWLAAVVRTRGGDEACRSPRLAVRALRDGAFVTRPNPADPPVWSDGALTLGDTEVFDVVDVDPDGSAIKAERFLTTIPRLALTELQGMPADAASPALRATGFTLTRRQQAGRGLDQLGRQEGYQAALEVPKPPQDLPLLHTQDVTRGLRVEVWDSVSRAWHSLHSRRSTLRVAGEEVYADEPGEGFVQGTSATETRGVEGGAVHVHEAMLGWEGWSLSVPRPGKRVTPVLEDAPGGGTHIREEAQVTSTDPTGKEPHPFVFAHEYAPGTLPRLRYGRDYAFRAWGVDLGGNVRDHHVGPRPPELVEVLDAVSGLSPLSDTALGRRLRAAGTADAPRLVGDFASGVLEEPRVGDLDAALDRLVTVLPDDPDAPVVGEVVRGGVAGSPALTAEDLLLDAASPALLHTVVAATSLGRPAAEAVTDLEARGASDDEPVPLRALGIRGVEARRVLAEAPPTRTGTGSRTAAVGDAFRRAAAAGTVARSTVSTDRAVTRELLAGHLADVVGGLGRPGLTVPGLRAAASLVTAARPFLRWDPVPPPVVVPLAQFTEGESLRVVVVRSGVEQDPETLAVTVTPPDEYAAAVAGVAPLYAGSARRHLAPPKTSQVQAELHSTFDAGIDEGTAEARRQVLAWAVRENGSWYDQEVPNPTDPMGAPSPQEGVRLLPEPVDGDHHNPHDPKSPLKVLPPGAPGTPPGLVLQPGDAPAPGQYVVHATEDLDLPYLPDPLASGVSLAFTEAGSGRHVRFPWGAEQVTAPYGGTWPEREPFLLSLSGADRLGASIDGRALDLHLPAGDVQTFRLASTVTDERLAWLGVWRSLDDALTSDPDVRGAAADGLLWALTPGEEVRLVHAVPRPVTAPRPTVVAPLRARGSVLASLVGGVEVHGPSTDKVTASLAWTDEVDDLTLPGPVQRNATAAGFEVVVRPEDRILPLWVADQAMALPGFEGVVLRGTAHPMPDTRHHLVRYRFRASTRFREYFAPALLAGDPADPLDDGQSVVSPELVVSLPSTERPDPPAVHSVLPLFRWEESDEPEQPFGRRRVRRPGVRIYLERPWNSSGDGELLAVLLAVGDDDKAPYPLPDPKNPEADPAGGFPFVSQWGADPIWTAPGVPRRPVTLAELDDGLSVLGWDDRVEPGRPVHAPVTLPLPLQGGGLANPPATVPVVVAGYLPRYSHARRQWYVDVAFDARATFWPFVRLAVARYQPDSVTGAHLSTPVRLDQVQLAPERTVSVARTDATHARVVVTGLAGHRESASRQYAVSMSRNRTLVARLQRYDPSVGGDLAWSSVDTVELVARGTASRAEDLVWVGELEADAAMDVRTPVSGVTASGVPEGSQWRVRVEEWERFPGDPPRREQMAEFGEAPVWQKRLVYADDVHL
ncbi:hypothetical protein [Phycicoccus avicenniae]|uniref:hypothetical protein n=1 Tax=Phycicoccus avicenniae TaxID=2828860 RepID=UPI003D277F77